MRKNHPMPVRVLRLVAIVPIVFVIQCKNHPMPVRVLRHDEWAGIVIATGLVRIIQCPSGY